MRFWEGRRAPEAAEEPPAGPNPAKVDWFAKEVEAMQRLADWRAKRREEALERFPIGSVVRLMSGGPDMTIADYDGLEAAHRVIWADAAGHIHTRLVGETVFMRIPESASGQAP
jgi:uncharacterized protein YodC (DUF2158 family)